MRASDFGAFHREVWGREAFPWQQRLAEEVLAEGWPELLDLPTGSGKTTALDVALFCLAIDPVRFARRIVLVVDRRVVVDQAHDRAQTLQAALAAPSGRVTQRVGERLRELWDGGVGEDPFATAVLRGGMPMDRDWALRPDRPLVAAATVDQVGSRLLFRGYGVSPSMSPVHAGLLGHDTLFLLDEVHLATTFAETLEAVRACWRPLCEAGLPDRWNVVQMSATPGVAAERRFQLGDADRGHAVLKQRLGARKIARLEEAAVRGTETARRATLAKRCAEAARGLSEAGATAVAVVVNRVDTAREVHRLLEAGKRPIEAHLLTGRMRPLDRDDILLKLLPRIAAGRERVEGEAPLVVVATQCIEAGADFDFDALVTECASLDALRQRFGRLDRLGTLGETRVVILGRSDQVAPGSEPDPVYGHALAATWEWALAQGDELNFGHGGVPLSDEQAAALMPPRPHAPVLLPSHLDTWVQTRPRPTPEPDVALWLHGPERASLDVTVVWRADVTAEALAQLAGEDGDLRGEDASSVAPADVGGAWRAERVWSEIIASLGACPPSSLEAMPVPLGAVRAWLAGESPVEVADVAVGLRQDDPEGEPCKRVLRWRGADTDHARDLLQDGRWLRPGDLLIVPAEAGGVRAGNWDPASESPVRDLGDRAQLASRGRGVLRLHPVVLMDWGLPPTTAEEPRKLCAGVESAASEADPKNLVLDWLHGLAEQGQPQDDLLETLRALGRRPRVVLEQGRPLAFIARGSARRGEVSTADDGASFTGRAVELAEHCGDVERWVRGFATRLGLPRALADDLGRAAWLHDVGKADPRFQRMLVGGSAVRLAGLEAPLAKSDRNPATFEERDRARRRAGYPAGYRHELLSLAMVQASEGTLEGVTDPDLVLHLIASHHGWCRPFAPAEDQPEDLEVILSHGSVRLEASTRHGLARLDSGVSDRFWSLVRRHGWWGLAWCEAILRLADHRASEESEARG